MRQQIGRIAKSDTSAPLQDKSHLWRARGRPACEARGSKTGSLGEGLVGGEGERCPTSRTPHHRSRHGRPPHTAGWTTSPRLTFAKAGASSISPVRHECLEFLGAKVTLFLFRCPGNWEPGRLPRPVLGTVHRSSLPRLPFPAFGCVPPKKKKPQPGTHTTHPDYCPPLRLHFERHSGPGLEGRKRIAARQLYAGDETGLD